MAETTRTTSGTSASTTSSSTSGGARNTSTPSPSSSTAAAATPSATTPSGAGRGTSGASPSAPNPSSTTAASPAGTSTGTATTGTAGSSQGQRSQSQSQQSQPGQRSAQGQQQRQQTQGQQTQGQQTQGQQTQGQQTQGQRRDEQGERGGGDSHVELSGNAMSDAKKVGSELVGAARDSAVSLIDAQRARAAEQITAVGDALRRSVESLDSTGAGALVQYVNQAADQVSGFADAVRDRSWNELADDLEGFARRSPAMFMASAVGLGFVLGRFLLSSSARTHAAGASGMTRSGLRGSEMRHEAGGANRTVPSGARAEYGSHGMRE
jgi:hypothetical protein